MIACYALRFRGFSARIPLMDSVRLWEPTSLRGFRWFGTRKSVAINIGWVRLPSCKWPKVDLRAAKWLIKKIWTNFTFCFSVFIAVFDKQVNICCSFCSISRLTSSRNPNVTDQAAAMDRYQNYFRKHDNLFSGKQQGAVRIDHKNILFLSTIF